MEKTLRMSLLFDFYGPLLTERQQDVFQMYFHEDLSLGEIAEQLEISRQAVYDLLKRASTILEDFESKLGLVAKHLERQEIYGELTSLLEQLPVDQDEQQNLIAQLKEKIRQAQATS